MRVGLICSAFVASSVFCHDLAGQCQIVNPSFELGSNGTEQFGGWSQTGTIRGSNSLKVHGQFAARIDSPGGTGEATLFQQVDTSSGERWTGGVSVAHSSAAPLVGSARAEVRVEWLNSSGGVISSETFDGVGPSSQTDTPVFVPITTGPAPTGSADARLVLTVRKTSAIGGGRAFFDLVSFDSTSFPTRAEQQLFDFPTERLIDFSGFQWWVKGNGSSFYGPGPNQFDASSTAVRVDPSGHLRMTIRNVGGTYRSTEIMTRDPLGYGDYRVTTRGDLDLLHHNTVLGLFTWEYPKCWDGGNPWNLHNEVDIEVSRWGDPNAQGSSGQVQFVAQPYGYPGNLDRFALSYTGSNDVVTHAFRWLPDRIEGRIWRGGPDDEATSPVLRTWTYTGPHIPREGLTRYHINLWHISPPTSDQEVIIEDFTYEPLGDITGGCCESGVCMEVTEAECVAMGGVYNGDFSACGPDTCPPAGSIELRLASPLPVIDDADMTITDPAAGVDLYVQARVVGDAEATGLVTFDGKLLDDLTGSFEATPLTILEATGLDIPGPDVENRTGMFPTYRGTIGSNNDDPGNGEPFGDQWAFLPLDIQFGGNGQGINGAWSNVYKFTWSSADATARSVTLDVSATFGGYQAIPGLEQPTPVIGDTLTLTIEGSRGCACEFDGAAGVDALDLLAFLGLWFPMDPGADYDGSGGVDVVDLLEFLACWFPASSGVPCP